MTTDGAVRQALHRQTDCPRLQEEHRPAALGKEDLKRENSAAEHGSRTGNEARGWSRVYPAAVGFCVWLNADFKYGLCSVS